MKATAAFIGGTPQVFAVPPIALIFVLAWLGIYCIMAAFIVSIGDIGPNKTIKFITAVKWNKET